MPADRNRVPIALDISKSVAMDFAELVKRLSRRSLGPSDLNLVTADEEENAESVLLQLRDALADAGYAPR